MFVSAPYATTGNYSGVIGSLFTVGTPMHGVGGYSWWFDLGGPLRVIGTASGRRQFPGRNMGLRRNGGRRGQR